MEEFDEAQECPRALTALKSFQQERPDVPIIAAGSLLGVALHGRRGEADAEPVSFPVGKVDHLMMYPMTFEEYLRGTGHERMAVLLESRDESLIGAFAERLTEELRRYYYVGGMPEAVATFAETRDYAKVRAVQTRLLTDYELDFSKHATPQLTERIRFVWRSLPGQLARENKKFLYSAVKPGARARGYEQAIQWLVDAGLALKVSRITGRRRPPLERSISCTTSPGAWSRLRRRPKSTCARKACARSWDDTVSNRGFACRWPVSTISPG